MKLGEIKIETLMLIFPSVSIEVDIENDKALNDALLTLREDPNYADYLVAMPGALNRCFSSLEQRGVLPTVVITIKKEQCKRIGNMLKLDISSLMPQIAQIEYIAIEKGCTYIPRHDYIRESASTILFTDISNEYTLVYTPKIRRISNITPASYALELPDEIACLIPYFLKSELIRSDDADEANTARALFEQGIAQLVSQKEGYQSSVDTVYEM